MAIPKFILYGPDNNIRLSFNVEFHLELIPIGGSRNEVKGGGRISVRDEDKKILFYGLSTDFGPCDKDDLIKAIKEAFMPVAWEGYKVFYSEPTIIDVSKAWEEAEEIHEIIF